MPTPTRKVLIVTGLSGAGLSTALRALEDLGYKAVDNLPLALVDSLLENEQGKKNPVAIGVDSRTWDFNAAQLIQEIDDLRQTTDIELLFIDCADPELQQRFNSTRRVHPMAVDRPVYDGIAAERDMMNPLRHRADAVIDTTDMNVHDLRRQIAAQYPLNPARHFQIIVTSFSFKQGLPREADLVFDVRFLDNPHWEENLRPLTGLDAAVGEKIKSDAGYADFYHNLTTLIDPLLPRYYHEGKSYLTIAVGCSGGKHRSVFVAEELSGWIAARDYAVTVFHRDLDREAEKSAMNKRAPKETVKNRKRKTS